MPRASKKRTSAVSDINHKMVNVDFSLEERDTINSWLKAFKGSFEQVALEIVDSSFKLSVSFDEYHDCYLASLTPKTGRKNDRPVYLLRHQDFDKLVGVTMYFFSQCLASGENEYDQSEHSYDW